MSENPGVVLATLASESNPFDFTSAWGNVLQYDASRNGYCLQPGGTLALKSGPRIAEARSQLVDQFFAEPLYRQAQWLLMIDSDMVPPIDLIDRMMAVADPTHVPVLGGLCFAGGRLMAPYPTIYEEVLVEREGYDDFIAIQPVKEYPRNALVKVGATGGACLLMHRNVLAAMSQPWPKGFGTQLDGTKNPYPWFIEGLVTPHGDPIGEDIAFCRRLAQMQVPIHVHTGVKLGHVKTFILDEEVYDFHQSLVAETKPETNGHGNRAERRRAAREALKAS